MKKILPAVVCCFLFAFSFAQTPVKTIRIQGCVLDSASRMPVGFATVSLSDAITKKPLKSGLTKDDGVFELNAPAQKAYVLSVMYVGYKPITMPVTGDANLNCGTLLLSPANSRLKEVAVNGLKPLMKQEVDRLSYDVAADSESKSVTALDMIRKVPLLSVDGNDNIMLRGSGNYKILLNGKESALMARNPSDILKAMPGTNIVKIEVITTPPAKYDAEGLAGIINIITKTNAAQGYNGSINTGYNTVNGYRVNLNTTVKQGKFGISGFVGTNRRYYMGTGFENKTTYLTVPSAVLQSGIRSQGSANVFGNAELSYELDSLNLLTGTFNTFNNNNQQGNDQFTQLYNGNNVLTQAYNVQSNGAGSGHGTDVGINYQLGFKHNKNQLLTASYKYSNSATRQDNDVVSNQQNAANYRQHNNAGSKEYTTQLDYIQPLKSITIEAGGKMILRDNFSNFINDVQNTLGNYVTNPALTNNFTYHQDVYSLYNSYTLKFTKWVVKGGVRLEHTDIDANFASSAGGNFNSGYNNLVPSVAIQRILKNSGVTFGFTQRIQRPGIVQLNPFADSSNPLYINMGNPALRPAVNNNFELGYSNSAKGVINFSTSYSFANNTIQTISTVSGNVTTNTFANLGKTRQLGFDLSVNYPVTKHFNVNLNLELLQIWLEGTYNGALLANSGQQGHTFTSYSYKFTNGYRIGLNINFDSRYVFLQGRDNYYFGENISASKEFFKNKAASISLSVSNPFNEYNRFDFFYKTADFATVNASLMRFQNININFNYKFGKLNSEIKKNQRGINNDDTSGGRN